MTSEASKAKRTVAAMGLNPMAIDQSDVYVTLKPIDQWPTKRSKDELIDAMQMRLQEEAPGRGL